MYLLLMFIGGVIVGSVITLLVFRPKTIGALRVDHSDPDGPYLFLELTDGIDKVKSKKYVTLQVKIKDYISRN